MSLNQSRFEVRRSSWAWDKTNAVVQNFPPYCFTYLPCFGIFPSLRLTSVLALKTWCVPHICWFMVSSPGLYFISFVTTSSATMRSSDSLYGMLLVFVPNLLSFSQICLFLYPVLTSTSIPIFKQGPYLPSPLLFFCFTSIYLPLQNPSKFNLTTFAKCNLRRSVSILRTYFLPASLRRLFCL